MAAILVGTIAGLLGGCTPYPRIIESALDPGGRSLNSPFNERSPDIAGRYIAFVSERQRRQNIYLYDLQTNQTIDLPGLNTLTTLASDPDVSSDGRYIVFVGNRQDRSGIYLYDRQARQVREIAANLRASVRNPTISADSLRIAFEASINGQWDILVYTRSGQPIEVPSLPPL
ncbi:MAG: Tol biopolymer transporter periplasmic protein [Oscillatoriales cyanobacterium]|nr:MAG: Tol biopolymer transporter periplasmic protein [Oscillatoriales cyanobacterium]